MKKHCQISYCPDCTPHDLCDYHKNPKEYVVLTAKDFYPEGSDDKQRE